MKNAMPFAATRQLGHGARFAFTSHLPRQRCLLFFSRRKIPVKNARFTLGYAIYINSRRDGF